MAEVKKNLFIKGKLQKDLDERLVPDGEYRDATNLRLVTSLNSNVGSATSVLGNENVTNFTIPSDATCIGATTDETSGRIFYFVTTPTYRDYVLEYNTISNVLRIILEDSVGRVLKFDTSFRITGANFIRGNELVGDQLSWTDGLNPPRKIYIETAFGFGFNNFNEDNVSLVKRPPFEAPQVYLENDIQNNENYIFGNYFLFAYRYIYEGQEVSSFSFFSESLVTEDDGLENSPNTIGIIVNTGDSRVVGFEIVFVKPQSNNYNLIRRVIKSQLGLSDNVDFTEVFTNNDVYQIISQTDTLKVYDNVPLVAKDQNYIANRLMYLNYVDGYNMDNDSGVPIDLDYNVSSVTSVGYSNTAFVASNPVPDREVYSFSTELLLKDDRIVYSTVVSTGLGILFSKRVSGTYYVKTKGIGTIGDFFTSTEFSDFVLFLISIYQEEGITIGVSANSTSLTITILIPGSFTYVSTAGRLSIVSKPTTLLSNQSQRFGIVYYDNYNRSGSVQYNNNGKVSFSKLSSRLNAQRGSVRVTIDHEPPSFATKYKIVRTDNNYNFNKLILNNIYKWSEEESYYLSFENNTDQNKITIGENIIGAFDSSIVFRAEEVVGNLPTDGQSTSVDTEFGLLKCTLIQGNLGTATALPPPPPSVGTIDVFDGQQFNTSEENTPTETYFECAETFAITNGVHEGNVQDQNSFFTQPAIVEITCGDAYLHDQDATSGVDLERFKFNDDLTGVKYEGVNKLRGNLESSFTIQRNRLASITYSDVYNSETAFNGLNSFNLSQLNFKELNEREGSIQRSFDREGDMIVWQEHQVSKVLVNRDAYFNSEGNINVTAASVVLGDQIHYMGEYGISLDPDSLAFWGNSLYYTDKNRGVVMELNGAGQFEISKDGMRGFFKKELEEDDGALRLGGYDPVHDEYVLSFGAGTLSYSSISQTWTQFYSFVPDKMINVRGKFYTIKGTDVYLHNSSNVPRNTFYGVTSPSKISFVVNPFPSTVKVFHNLRLQGNKAWDANIKVYKSDSEDFFESTLLSTDFSLREGFWYSELKRSEIDSTSSKATYGLGTVTFKQGNNITINGGNCALTVGDDLYTTNPSVTLVGEILSVNGSVLTLSDATNVSVNDFVYGQKNMRIEGNEMRGYVARIDLELNDTEKIELYGVDSYGVQSNP